MFIKILNASKNHTKTFSQNKKYQKNNIPNIIANIAKNNGPKRFYLTLGLSYWVQTDFCIKKTMQLKSLGMHPQIR